MIDHIDPVARLIYLDASTVNVEVHPIGIYREMRELRKSNEYLRQYNLFMEYKGADKKNPSGSKRTERYAVLLEGTKIVPYDTSHEITIIGTIISDTGLEGPDVFNRDGLSPNVEVDINYVPKQVEIITINTSGVGAQEVWEYPDRTLTSSTTGDVNIVSVNSVPVFSPDDFKADLSLIPQNVWEYVTRTLTSEIGMTVDQELKLDQVLLDIEKARINVNNTSIAMS